MWIGAGVYGLLRHNGDQGTKADKSECQRRHGLALSVLFGLAEGWLGGWFG